LAFHLFTLSVAIYLRPADRVTPLIGGTDLFDFVRYAFEILTIINCISYVVFQQGHEIKNTGNISGGSIRGTGGTCPRARRAAGARKPKN
jgi:hypothetical protein